jgi:hypothetical protein
MEWLVVQEGWWDERGNAIRASEKVTITEGCTFSEAVAAWKKLNAQVEAQWQALPVEERLGRRRPMYTVCCKVRED